MGQEHNIVGLANSSNFLVTNADAKSRLLGSLKLLIVVQNIEVTRGDPSLLKAKLIVNGPKDPPVPLDEGFSVFESVVEIDESLTSCANKMKLSDSDFPYCKVKSRPCI